jgi:flagellar L-ring protein precursor FlgH
VDEAASATHDDSTSLDHKSSSDFGVAGALSKAAPGVDLGKLFGTSTNSSLNGSGKIERRGRLQGMLPVRVRGVLPNGDLFVEGTKITTVGEEAHHLYLSGVVRPVDILADGSVPSSRVADAEIEYTGRGDASDQQRKGWFSRLLGKVWPF